MSKVRIGVDVGGTFTDVVLWDEESERLHVLKTPSVPTDPSAGVITGVRRALEDTHARTEDITAFINGTTVAVNTLIQRNGAPVGMLVTRGFRDVLELRRVRLPGAPSFEADRPQPLVPRRHVKEVGERLRADGSMLRPVPWDDVETAMRELIDAGIAAIAICFLHSYHNAEHEAAVKVWITERYPEVYVCASHELWPQQREYERSLVTVMNAYIGSTKRSYYQRIQQGLLRLGVGAPILATKSNGGVMSAEAARPSRAAAGRGRPLMLLPGW